MDDRQASVLEQVRRQVVAALGIESRESSLARDTALIGGIPEFDSMAVLQVMLALEEHFEFEIHDDEVTGEIFETLGTLTDFVERKLR